jgi:hypothetical protein
MASCFAALTGGLGLEYGRSDIVTGAGLLINLTAKPDAGAMTCWPKP